ncbi:MAG: hypothetical protein KAJ19_22730 [Gammaproteobacteria bacterium]|nr:hypothetical protein [Gammaproteobacteria bacterium]
MKCPRCQFEGEKSDFYETEVGCSDCGSHGALGCPKCDNKFDLVYEEWEE